MQPLHVHAQALIVQWCPAHAFMLVSPFAEHQCMMIGQLIRMNNACNLLVLLVIGRIDTGVDPHSTVSFKYALSVSGSYC